LQAVRAAQDYFWPGGNEFGVNASAGHPSILFEQRADLKTCRFKGGTSVGKPVRGFTLGQKDKPVRLPTEFNDRWQVDAVFAFVDADVPVTVFAVG